MLPEYVDENAISDSKLESDKPDNLYEDIGTTIAQGAIVLDITDITVAQTYLYLSTFRLIREDPGVPTCTIHLVDDCGMNFYAAYVYATKVAMGCTGHHIISLQRTYGSRYDKELRAPLGLMIGIHRFVDEPKKYDKRTLFSTNYGFECNATIGKISNIETELSFQELFDEDVIEAVMAKTDKESQKYLDTYLEKKDHIVYTEAKENAKCNSSAGA